MRARLGDFETVKKRLIGSRYIMDFNDGVNFNLDVVTSDGITASTLSSLIKAGALLPEDECERDGKTRTG